MRQVCWRSPMADTNTSTKVAGTSPPNLPTRMKASRPPMMQPHPRHSGGGTSSASSSATAGETAIFAIIRPSRTSRTPRIAGNMPGPMRARLPSVYVDACAMAPRPSTIIVPAAHASRLTALRFDCMVLSSRCCAVFLTDV
ncbi:hypothetical protein D3C72_1935160 [compost metagenome]